MWTPLANPPKVSWVIEPERMRGFIAGLGTVLELHVIPIERAARLNVGRGLDHGREHAAGLQPWRIRRLEPRLVERDEGRNRSGHVRGFREQAFPVTGEFLEIKGVELKPGEEDPDVARYEFRAAFERDDDLLFMIAFYPGSRTVDGVQLEPSS